MAGANPYPSLLPYLETGKGRFRLKVALISSERSVLERGPYPFRVLAESGPFARIIAADILTDAESPIKGLFLLRQPDDYRNWSDDPRPLANPDIDRFWQEAYHWYRSASMSSSAPDAPLLLAGQTDAEDRLLACYSLFYCLLRQAYFHPLCPQCGLVLELCRRDDILNASGLKPYAGSLRRYLYCPDCARRTAETNFYVFALQVDDPPGLRDRWALIHDFANLLVKPDLEDRFPCSTCPEKIACYGPDDLSGKRIVPFAFYPFYLMIFEAATMHAMDFVALLSGATLDQLAGYVTESGRRHTPDAARRKLSRSSRFLFGNSDSRHFLEVLFLKLAFLGELSAWALQAGSSPQHPNLPLSLNRVWVQLPDQAGLLPSLWNFKPMRFDVGLPEYGRPEPLRHASAPGLYHMAMVWFYTLVVNQRQDIRQVSEILEQICDKLVLSAAPVSQSVLQEVNASTFQPQNTFWDPAAHRVEPEFESLWRQALDLGASLLKAGLDREARWSQESFNRQFDALRESVRQELFSTKQPAEPSDQAGQDAAILHILENLSHKWRSDMRHRSVAEDLGATVLIRKKTVADSHTVAVVAREDDDLQKTVILSPKPAVRESSEQPEAMDLEKTVILPSRTPGSPTAAGIEPPEDDLIQETVLLSSREFIPGPTRPKTTLPRPSEPDLPETIIRSPEEEYLEKTVIQRPADSGAPESRGAAEPTDEEKTILVKPAADKDKRPPADIADDLGETVIIKPKTGKSK